MRNMELPSCAYHDTHCIQQSSTSGPPWPLSNRVPALNRRTVLLRPASTGYIEYTYNPPWPLNAIEFPA